MKTRSKQNSLEAADELFMPLHVFPLGLITEMISRDTLNSLHHINKSSVMHCNIHDRGLEWSCINNKHVEVEMKIALMQKQNKTR